MIVDGISTNHSRLPARTALPTAARWPASAAGNPDSGYLGDIRRFAILEKELEYRLAKRWREQGDRKAADQIVTSHLRLAAKIARNYRGYGLPLSEVISEGNVGLMQAINRFDPDRGFRFATYAIWWIRASIQDYILRSWSLVKIGTTASQKKLFFKLRSAKAKISALDNAELRPDQVTTIATTLGVENRDVVDMNRRLGGDLSLNASIRDEDNAGEWLEQLVDESPSPEAIVVELDEMDHRRDALVRAIGVLNDRERRIFEARHLVDEPMTLEDLAIQFKVSRERIRQLEAKAFEKVQAATKRSVRARSALVAMHA
ncbi:RNA polymerase sigma factor RpoH [Bradyrhizobium sp.]|uniref:RNA polymerase sigma factor RpoH n=1 Tax=Bradyrhizobium sp. TaxID=376 RepID=UPI003C4A6743